MSEEIKPCPFCGHLPYWPTNIKKNKAITSCANNKCVMFNMIDMTVKQWNKRPDNWISVEMEMPEDDLSVWVLICSPTTKVMCCPRNSAMWINTNPTHWQPLPELPKGE